MTDQNFIISPAWLAENLDEPDLIIVDCRFSLADPALGQQQYQVGHLPGAFYLDLNRDLASPVGKRGGRHPLPNVTEFAEKLSAIGVNSGKTLVVAYDDSRFAFASRLWWLLRYLGHDRVALLDGGFGNWQQAGYPVENTLPTPQPGQFVPHPQPEWVVDLEGVKARKDLLEVAIVDSRESDRYQGLREPIDPIAGHIPNAVNYPWQEVTDAEGKAKSSVDQRQRWMEARGGKSILDAREVIVYCGSGVTACVNLLSLELAGIRPAKLYAGSWSDWCSDLLSEESQ